MYLMFQGDYSNYLRNFFMFYINKLYFYDEFIKIKIICSL